MTTRRFRSCRKASSLIIASRDRRLGLLERGGLLVHLGMCGMCRRFRGQMQLMNASMDHWKSYKD